MKTERAEALIELTDSYVPDLESMDVVFRIVYLPWEQDQGITRDGTGGRELTSLRCLSSGGESMWGSLKGLIGSIKKSEKGPENDFSIT